VTRDRPETDCYDLAFQAHYPLDEASEVAIEDYARTLTQARATEALRQSDEPSMVEGIHVCGLGTPLTQAILTDLEDFARGLVVRDTGGGLGWS
jgi:hypothetical protein